MSAGCSSEIIIHDAPTDWIRPPRFETVLAIQTLRKIGYWNGVSAERAPFSSLSVSMRSTTRALPTSDLRRDSRAWERRRIAGKARHVECVQRHRHERVEADRLDDVHQALLAPHPDRPVVQRLRQILRLVQRATDLDRQFI